MRHTTLSTRRVAVLAGGLLAGLTIALTVGNLPRVDGVAPPGEADPGGAPRSATAEPRTPAQPVPTATTTPVPPTSDEERVEGQQVAADFVAAHVRFRYDESGDARVERMRPFVTDALAAQLSSEEGGRAGRLELTAREQLTDATVERIQPQTIGDGWMDLLVVVRADHRTVDGEDTAWESVLTRVVRTADGWRVDGFQP